MVTSFKAPPAEPPGVRVTRVLEDRQRHQTFACEAIPGITAARAWSEHLVGTVYWTPLALIHVQGSYSRTWIPETITTTATGERKAVLPDLEASHRMAADLIGGEPGWTYPRMARSLIEWLQLGQTNLATELRRVLLPTWHYQRVIPGVYEDAYLYDLTAAYWQVVEQVPSPLFTFSADARKLYWQALSTTQQVRWQELKARCKPFKRLRLAIVGASSAGWSEPEEVHDGVAIFNHGTRQRNHVPPTQLQPLALLAVRCTYELCQIQSEPGNNLEGSALYPGKGSVYSNADCVVLVNSGQDDFGFPSPGYWDELKLDYRLKAEGPARIHAIYARWVGDDDTAPRRAIGDRSIWIPHQSNRVAEPTLHLQVWGKKSKNSRRWYKP